MRENKGTILVEVLNNNCVSEDFVIELLSVYLEMRTTYSIPHLTDVCYALSEMLIEDNTIQQINESGI